MSVWNDLVGQEPAVDVLRGALRPGPDGGPARVGHAWLITGPPGSGRSNAARAFAAGLQCERTGSERGCGACNGCRTALAGSDPDVTLIRTEHLSLRVDEIRELVRKAAMSPVGRHHQVLIVEDADRLTEQAADALLKSLEEPAERTVWLLCAPTVEDVVPTIRSRCRLLVLRTPGPEAVAAMLRTRDGVDEETARFAAYASQGHIGRARALARSEAVRDARRRVLAVPGRLTDLAGAVRAAAELVDAAVAEAKETSADLDATEKVRLEETYAVTGGRGTRNRTLDAARRDLEERQKVRAKRLQRDVLDRALLDLTTFYRDVLMVRTRGAQAALVNEDLRAEVLECAGGSGVREATLLEGIDAILECRLAIAANVAPLLAVEAATIALWRTTGGGSGSVGATRDAGAARGARAAVDKARRRRLRAS